VGIAIDEGMASIPAEGLDALKFSTKALRVLWLPFSDSSTLLGSKRAGLGDAAIQSKQQSVWHDDVQLGTMHGGSACLCLHECKQHKGARLFSFYGMCHWRCE
jgi:hypothetical protein